MDDEKCCCICREDILFDVARPEPCSHIFHKECIEQWSKISNTCPLCKVRFTVLQCGSTSIPVEDKIQVMSSQVEDDLNRAAIELALTEDGGSAVADQRRYFADDSAANPEIIQSDGYESDPGFCSVCGMLEEHIPLLICEGCEGYYHTLCVGLRSVPTGDWFCQSCIAHQAREMEEIQRRKEERDRRLNDLVPSPPPRRSSRRSNARRHPSVPNSHLCSDSSNHDGRHGHSGAALYLSHMIGYESDAQTAVAIHDATNQVLNQMNENSNKKAYEEDEEYVPSDHGMSSDNIDHDSSDSDKGNRLKRRRLSHQCDLLDDDDSSELDFDESEDNSLQSSACAIKKKDSSETKKPRKKEKKKKRKRKPKSNVEFLQSTQLKRHSSTSKKDSSHPDSSKRKKKAKKRSRCDQSEVKDATYNLETYHKILSKRRKRTDLMNDKSPTPVTELSCFSSSSLLSWDNPGLLDSDAYFGSINNNHQAQDCSHSISNLSLHSAEPDSPFIHRSLAERVLSNRKRRRLADVTIVPSKSTKSVDSSASSESSSSSDVFTSPVNRSSQSVRNINDDLFQTVKMKRRPKKMKNTEQSSTKESQSSKKDFLLSLVNSSSSMRKPKRKRRLSEVDT